MTRQSKVRLLTLALSHLGEYSNPPPDVQTAAGLIRCRLRDLTARTRPPSREPYNVGDRMRITAAGIRQLVGEKQSAHTSESRGAFVGYARHSGNLRIKRDGIKSITNYHPTFWELDPGDT